MNRRTGLGLVGVLGAGCLGTSAPTGDTSTTTATTTTSCSVVETGFDRPELEQPTRLTTETAGDPPLRLESAYVDALAPTPRDVGKVPNDVDSFRLTLSNPQVEAEGDTAFRVDIRGTARYAYYGGENTSETEYHADRPVMVAQYHVTDRRIRRVDGIGSLRGTLVCW
jgi:hypothetical protein